MENSPEVQGVIVFYSEVIRTKRYANTFVPSDVQIFNEQSERSLFYMYITETMQHRI